MAGELAQASASMSIDWQFLESLTLSTSSNSGSRTGGYNFAKGDGAGEANRVYAVKASISASGSTTLDLTALTDFFNSALAFDSIRAVYLELLSDTAASSILVGGAGVQNPSTAPTLAEVNAGSLAAGTYRVAYTFENAAGETMISPVTAITIGASKDIRVSAITLPSGAVDINYYCSFADTGLALGYQGDDTGAAYDITSLPAVNAAAAPQSNTTGTGLTSLFGNDFDTLRVRNGGGVLLLSPTDSAGYAVTSTKKVLRLYNEDSVNTAVYALILLGSEDT